MKGYKQHTVFLPDEINLKALKIKKLLKLKNLSELFVYFVKEFKNESV